MSLHTTFRIGGPADAYLVPEDAAAAAALLAAARAEGLPLFVLGGGANVLVGDGGIRGLVMDTSRLRTSRLERGPESSPILVAGCGLPMDELCLEALGRGLGGLEDFAGMPGSVGGAVFMNARCYDAEISRTLAWVDSLDAGLGRVARRPAPGPGWDYKRSPYQPGGPAAGELVLEAAFRLAPAGDEAVPRIARVMRERRADREAKGHYRLPSAGSVFKNDRSLGAPTGVILDRLGLRGKRVGDAMVSQWHANIFVNAGTATGADMRSLIELAQGVALERLGARLEREVLMVGEF